MTESACEWHSTVHQQLSNSPSRRGRQPLTVRPLSTSTRTRRLSIFLPSACLYAAAHRHQHLIIHSSPQPLSLSVLDRWHLTESVQYTECYAHKDNTAKIFSWLHWFSQSIIFAESPHKFNWLSVTIYWCNQLETIQMNLRLCVSKSWSFRSTTCQREKRNQWWG